MPAARRLPDSTTLLRLRRDNWKLAEIAEEYGVTEAAVWKALERSGNTKPQLTYKDIVPWEIAPEHRAVAVMVRIRSIVRQRSGIALSEQEHKLLTEWLGGMDKAGVVLNYHPEAPPNAASSKGGFYYTPREPGDAWIFREPHE